MASCTLINVARHQSALSGLPLGLQIFGAFGPMLIDDRL
jgi:hypothetical protein